MTSGQTRLIEVTAAIGLGVEALALAIAAIAYGIYAVFGNPADAAFIGFIGVFCVMLAVGVGMSARGTWNGRRWARSIALTWQVFQAGVGLSVVSTRPGIGVTLILVALVVAVCVMARAGQDVPGADDAVVPL